MTKSIVHTDTVVQSQESGAKNREFQDRPATHDQRRTRNIYRLILAILIVAGVVTAGILLPVKQYLQAVLQWADSLGTAGPVVVAASYIVACVLFLPGSILTLGAGALFGVVIGTITVSIGSVLGASAAFIVGRTFARDWVAKKVAGNAKFNAIDQAVGQQGFKIVLLTRLSPIFPFNLLNYALGLTKVKFRHYLLGSWIGMLPGTVMYVYLGSAAGSLVNAAAGNVQQTPAQQAFFWVGLAATIVVAMFVTRIARKALAEATTEVN